MQKTHLALLAATALSGLAGINAVTAQETVLGPIIVSAGLSPFAQNEVGRSFTVIDSAKIEQTKPAYIADILRQVPGVAISASGSAGSTTQVRMRGAEGNHVLVLIDGVPTMDNSSGEFDFGRLSVSDIESVEVLRGPQSAFWGSNALAGVINIITKSGTRNGMSTSLATEFGTDGTKMGAVEIGYGQDNFDLLGSVSIRHTDGFNISSLGSELDGATHLSANLKFNADITPTLSVDGVVRYGFVHADTDDQNWMTGIVEDTFDTTRGNELLGALGFKWESEDGQVFQTSRISGTRVDRENFDTTGTLSGATTGDTYKGSYQIGRHFQTPELADSEHTITLGYDLIAETFTRLPPNALAMQTRTTNSFVGEYRGKFANQFDLTAALRHDINDQFANATTYSLSGAWNIPNSETTLHASVGTGSTNPTFVEQFGWDPASFIGNPALLPETSFGWDIGVRQTLLDGMVTLDVTYFNQDLENEIFTDYSGPIPTAANDFGISTRKGIEVSALLDLYNGFTASASYTYTDSRDPNGDPEVRRPMHTGVINLAYAFEEIPLKLHSELVLVGDAHDMDWGTYTPVTLPAHTILNAGLNYQVNDSVEVYGRIHNLFDTSYQTVYGYNNPGRTFYVGAKAKF